MSPPSARRKISASVRGSPASAAAERSSAGVLHNRVIPVAKQGNGVDLLSGIAGARRLLHLLQHREQILQGGDLRRADLLIEIKPKVRPVGGLRGLRGLIRGKKGDLTGHRPEALLPRQIRAALDGALVAGQVLLAGEVRDKVQDKTRLDHVGEIVPADPDQDEVPQVPVGGPRLAERVPPPAVFGEIRLSSMLKRSRTALANQPEWMPW